MLEDQFFKSMESLGPYEDRPVIAIALSGGSDSTCLTSLSNKWVKKKGGKIIALIINYNLNKRSESNCKLIQKELDRKNIANYSFNWSNKNINSGLQKKARDFRYMKFEEWCYKHNVFHLLLGHHFDDQKETLLIRLNSNSNAYGLSCMNRIIFKKKIRILRPMLNFTKKQILNYLNKEKINWIEDPSNQLNIYTRNRYRKSLPFFKDKGVGDKKFKKIISFSKNNRKKTESNSINWLIKNLEIDPLGYAALSVNELSKLDKDSFNFIVGRVMRTISGNIYSSKTKYINNFYRNFHKKKLFLGKFNLGGCSIFYNKPKSNKVFFFREILKENKKQFFDLNYETFFWDNRFEVSFKKNMNLYFKKNLSKSFYIDQLKEEGWKKIQGKESIKEKYKIPTKLFFSLPSIKRYKDKQVLFVPHLKYFYNKEWKEKFVSLKFDFKPDINLSNFN